MLIRALLVIAYIVHCCRLRIGPWKYFQLNAPYFNEQRNLFSKLDIDKHIPEQWRLEQFMDFSQKNPHTYPVFVKPEWGQNSQGISRADSFEQLRAIRKRRTAEHPRYLIQQAAPGKREFEVFVILSDKDNGVPAVLSITETCNNNEGPLAVNGIYNKNTFYRDLSEHITAEQKDIIWSHLQQIGQFRIARYGIRADSIEALAAGQFHIIEINLFVPMPLVLLVKQVSISQKIHFVISTMKHLAAVTKTIPASQVVKPVFFKKLKRSRALKALTKNEVL
ncbi:hypothetical protein [Psychromonas ossibalaenae]|uniref:hypothetical protein n=1 Tax=Psychromonas ossibalaenae TaxID=444922 RepID=UPI00037652E1|nr:hypothetical protein [Psychromonas ossibalaenae]